MRQMIENYINGNLADAKAQAKRFSWREVYIYLRTEFDWSQTKATAVADYLKGKGTFQAACDAE